MAKTTVVIDEKLLEEAKKAIGTSTIKDTVNESLRIVGRQAKLMKLASLQGSGFIDLTQEELEEMRKDRL